MFVQNSLRTSVSYQAIAMLVLAALLVWTVGAQFIGEKAEAANVTTFSDVLTDSRAGQLSDHIITFTLPNGAVDNETIIIDFDAEFTLGAADFEDVDVRVGGVDQVVTATGVTTDWGATFSGNALTLVAGSGGVASSTQLIVEVGAVATFTDVGASFITNPTGTTTSKEIEITEASTIQDFGITRVAITDAVLVTADVPTRFDFVVNGTPLGFTIPGVATTTSSTTSSFALPFGTLLAGTSKTLAHQLNVTTNAKNGFNVTVEQTQDLLSSTGAIIDSFIDGLYTDSPAAWQAPGTLIGDDTTWGHWGLTSDDDVFNAGVNDRWVAASTTQPRQIFSHASSSDGIANDIGSTTVGYQIQISALQEAGNDYTTTLIYIATPTF